MARARSSDRQPPSLHRTLSTPGLYLWRMFVFLVLVGLLVAVLHQQLWAAMLNNLGLNVLICFVLLAGVLYAFQQVLRLYPEIRASPSRSAPSCCRRWRPCFATAPARSRSRPPPCARSWIRSAAGSMRP